MEKEDMQKTLRCIRCGWKWVPRVEGRLPKFCPGCKSPRWNEPKRPSK